MESKLSLISRYKWFIISLAAVMFILFIFFGANMLLFWNLAIGKDTVVRLESGKADFQIVHGDEDDVSIEASVITNPFCSAECSYNFIDVSRNLSLDNDSFILKASQPVTKKYALKAESMAKGIGLYRFDMECISKRTSLCRTSQSPSTRTLLITVEHSLSEEDKSRISELKSAMDSWIVAIGSMAGILAASNNTLKTLPHSYDYAFLVSLASDELDSEMLQLGSISASWHNQQFDYLFSVQGPYEKAIISSNTTITKLYKDISSDAVLYNSIISSLNESRQRLIALSESFIISSTIASSIDDTILLFNNAASSLNALKIPDSRTIELNLLKSLLSNKIIMLSALLNESSENEAVSRSISLFASADALCLVSGICFKHSSPEYAAGISIESACSGISSFIEFASGALPLLNLSSDDDIMPEDIVIAGKIKSNISRSYMISIPANASAKVIAALNVSNSSFSMPSFNNTSGLIKEIIRQQGQCKRLNTTYIPAVINVSYAFIYNPEPLSLNISFGEPAPVCCIWGICSECCSQCSHDPGTYPVILLHGHAISKAISAEYSLEGFTKLQNKLEDDNNYLDAGAITIYSEKPSTPGLWGMFNIPVTLRASFYFDFFRQPERNIIIQTKSENIDTYAIRLKELVDSIKYRTGKDKVILVPFSMGGLVARRYLQLFGSDDVHKLILIGVPNHGISGRIASLCPLTGEQKECNDMQSDSLFMSKLNSVSLPDIPIYNIIGTGCDMEGSRGDGAVLEKSALLEGAVNFIISGTCRTLTTPLHLDLLDPELYPQVYDIIRDAIAAE